MDAERERARMVETQLRARGIRDERVLAALGRVPRERFVPRELRARAYEDGPLPIGGEQTISQPYIVALMTELLELAGGERVLEVGTGCGYQTAVLAELAGRVFSIELDAELQSGAAARLAGLGYGNVELRVADGYWGWPEEAPFAAILVAAAAPREAPPPLVEQLAGGGRLVLPVGEWEQALVRVVRDAAGTRTERVLDVRFVPLRGRAQA